MDWPPLALQTIVEEGAMAQPWSQAEDDRLTFFWGERDIEIVAEAIGRTPVAITKRARQLGLTSFRGLKSMRQLVMTSGYNLETIRTAVEVLGLTLYRRRRTEIDQRVRTRTFAITEEQEQAILRYLGSRPDGQRLFKIRDRKRTQRGVWGIGIKPPACLVCHRTDRPHCAKGECDLCYKQRYKKRYGKRGVHNEVPGRVG
jgi:hypothetical protein